MKSCENIKCQTSTKIRKKKFLLMASSGSMRRKKKVPTSPYTKCGRRKVLRLIRGGGLMCTFGVIFGRMINFEWNRPTSFSMLCIKIWNRLDCLKYLPFLDEIWSFYKQSIFWMAKHQNKLLIKSRVKSHVNGLN